jgi:hypothetical protein
MKMIAAAEKWGGKTCSVGSKDADLLPTPHCLRSRPGRRGSHCHLHLTAPQNATRLAFPLRRHAELPSIRLARTVPDMIRGPVADPVIASVIVALILVNALMAILYRY